MSVCYNGKRFFMSFFYKNSYVWLIIRRLFKLILR